MAVGDLVQGAQMVDWYNRLNAIRGAVGIGSAGVVNPIGSNAYASHINDLVNAITSTYFGSSKLLTFAAAPIVANVSVGQIIAWDTAFRIDFTLNNMNTAASFSTQSTQGTQSTFHCGTQSTQGTQSTCHCGTQSTQSTCHCGTQSTQSTFHCGTQGTLSTFNQCGNNKTNWVFSDTCFTFRSQRTSICGTASQTNCKTTY